MKIRRAATIPLAKQLTEQVKPLALPEAYFEFKFEPLEAAMPRVGFIQLFSRPTRVFHPTRWPVLHQAVNCHVSHW